MKKNILESLLFYNIKNNKNLKSTIFLILIFSNLLFTQEKKILFIGIDGCRPDALQMAKTPNIDTIIKDGLYIKNGLCSINGQPTISGPGWSTMLTGVWYDKHGVSDNSFKGGKINQYPPFNIRMKNKSNKYHIASFIMWEPIHQYIFKNSMDYNKLFFKFDESIAIEASKYMNNLELDVMFLNFDHVDHAGHWYGFSPKKNRYIKSIEKIDEYIGWVINSMKNRSTFKKEDWLIIITSDHGGIKRTHGGQSMEEKRIPIILSGQSFNKDTVSRQAYLTDIIPTILDHFNIESDSNWNLDGESLLK